MALSKNKNTICWDAQGRWCRIQRGRQSMEEGRIKPCSLYMCCMHTCRRMSVSMYMDAEARKDAGWLPLTCWEPEAWCLVYTSQQELLGSICFWPPKLGSAFTRVLEIWTHFYSSFFYSKCPYLVRQLHILLAILFFNTRCDLWLFKHLLALQHLLALEKVIKHCVLCPIILWGLTRVKIHMILRTLLAPSFPLVSTIYDLT